MVLTYEGTRKTLDNLRTRAQKRETQFKSTNKKEKKEILTTKNL